MEEKTFESLLDEVNIKFEGKITSHDLTIIKDKILVQCSKYIDMLQNQKDLFYYNYTKKRRKPSLTAAILSAFIPNNYYGTLFCNEIKYGLGLYQPELSNDNVIIHIYNSTNSLDSGLIKEYVKKYNNDISTKKYIIIIYNSDEKGNLYSLSLKFISLNGDNYECCFYKIK